MKKIALLFTLAIAACVGQIQDPSGDDQHDVATQSPALLSFAPSTWYWQPPTRPDCQVVLSFDASSNYELHTFCPKDATTYYEQIRTGNYTNNATTLVLNIVQTTCAREPLRSLRFMYALQADGTLRLIDDWEVAYLTPTAPFDVSTFSHETGCFLPQLPGSLLPSPGWAAGALHNL